ncbi:MAG: DUF21 domain-containing protein [Gammaproteobacteria bacterium]|nr:DUF21 domain-containing protein [Gammaproteobacteria bacterium]
MDTASIPVLSGFLILLIVLSAFFSATETAMMRLNRHRLRHFADQGNRRARLALDLLERPDRLIGIILLGNNFVNILASSVSTIIALRTLGQAWIAASAGLLTFVILIAAEVTPKTAAALHPERIAFPAVYIITPLLKLCYPLVWVINVIANGILRMFGITAEDAATHQLGSEELRIVVNEASGLIPDKHQQMLLNILDLEKAHIEDIMIPRNEIVGINLNQDIDEIAAYLRHCPYTRVPLYRDDINNVVAMLHARNLLPLMKQEVLTHEDLLAAGEEPYFVPEGTPLNTQLLNFQNQKSRIGLVVDEYGDIEGLITLEDILEEIIGEFTTDVSATISDIHPQDDGSHLIDGSVNLRALNRIMNWNLPTDGPNTLSGLIIEYLETIPQTGTSMRIAGYTMEVIQVGENMVKTVRVKPPAETATPPLETVEEMNES